MNVRNYKPESDENLLSYWISIIRIIGAVVVETALLILWKSGLFEFDPRPVIFWVVPIYFVASMVWFMTVKRVGAGSIPVLSQLLIDVIVITTGLWYAGGSRDPFIFLYILPVISAAFISLRLVIQVSIISLLLYAFLIFGDILLNGLDVHTAFGAQHVPDVERFIVFVAVYVLIAFQASYLRLRIRRKEDELQGVKDEFLFRTVHDLRSPSTAIRLVLEQYTDTKWLREHPETVEDIEIIRNANERMLGLIRDVVAIARGEHDMNAAALKPVALSEIVQRAIRESGPATAKKGVSVRYERPDFAPKAIGNAEKLAEVFGNLIDNAVKYNRTAGSVTISHRVDKKMCYTDIADTGIGISEQSIAKLFSPYFRGDVGSEIPGTGLGLYIVKSLVENMGGSISVTSKKGEGTRFTVSLPLAA